jgi:hypothetical protein
LVEEYWLNLNEGQLVEGKPVFDAKWFKWSSSMSNTPQILINNLNIIQNTHNNIW